MLVVLGIFMYAIFIFIFIENNMLIKWQSISLMNLEQMILFYFIMEVNLNKTLATVEAVIDTIIDQARTGEIGDGKIFGM